jgi:metal-sulfur cluster biosynthetic enzyme
LEIALVTSAEVFDALKPVMDPDYPVSITDPRLGIVTENFIEVRDRTIRVRFKPTSSQCPMGGLIGILIRHRLEDAYKGFKVQVTVVPGTHVQESAVNSMISDDSKYNRIVQQLEQQGML